MIQYTCNYVNIGVVVGYNTPTIVFTVSMSMYTCSLLNCNFV